MPERNTTARYEQMSVDELSLQLDLLAKMLKTFLLMAGYPSDVKYNVDVRAIVEIITRVDKRTAYYSFFHDGNQIHEMKRVGIFVYWLLKLKPITIIDEKQRAFDFNENFALSLIYSGLMKLGKMQTVPAKDSAIHKYLLYALKYRELPQDSVMTLVYSLYLASDLP